MILGCRSALQQARAVRVRPLSPTVLAPREAGRDGDVDRKQRLEKVMARLSNPLLRQPAPFEAGSTGY